MEAGKLFESMKVFRSIVKADEHNIITLTPETAVAGSEWAYAMAKVHTGLPEGVTVIVDGQALLNILASLSPTTDVVFHSTDAALSWSCGAAKGRLARLERGVPEALPESNGPSVPATPAMLRGLTLGALSCAPGGGGAATRLDRLTIYGEGDQLLFGSIDNATISIYTMKTESPVTGQWLLGATGAQLLSEACGVNAGVFKLGDRNVTFYNEWLRVTVALAGDTQPHDVRKLSKDYDGEEVQGELNRKIIQTFIRRANNLAENAESRMVQIGADNRRIVMEFSDSVNETTEYYLADSLPDMGPNFSVRVKCDASKVARALEHCDKVILDHHERRVLVFTGPDFHYLMMGKKS
jgi:hypothetical protein